MSTNGGACRDMIAVTLPMPRTDPKQSVSSVCCMSAFQFIDSAVV